MRGNRNLSDYFDAAILEVYRIRMSLPELIDCICVLAGIVVEHIVILLELPVVLWQRSFLQFFGRKLLFARPKKGGSVVAKANEFCAPGEAKFTYASSGAAEHSTSLTSSGQSLLLASPQRGAVHRRPSLQPFLWAQQPHKPNEIREGKNKGAIGLRQV